MSVCVCCETGSWTSELSREGNGDKRTSQVHPTSCPLALVAPQLCRSHTVIPVTSGHGGAFPGACDNTLVYERRRVKANTVGRFAGGRQSAASMDQLRASLFAQMCMCQGPYEVGTLIEYLCANAYALDRYPLELLVHPGKSVGTGC